MVTLYLDRLKHLPYIVSNWDDHPGLTAIPVTTHNTCRFACRIWISPFRR